MTDQPEQLESGTLGDLVPIIGLEAAVNFAIDVLGMVPEQARFMLALELGELESDVIKESDEP